MKPDYILFTDGSSITERGKRMQYAAYAFLVINNNERVSTKKADIIGQGDSARAELFAIYNGLKYIHSLIKNGSNKTVLVLSDSKYAISLISKYLLRWYRNEKIKPKPSERFKSDTAIFKDLARILLDDKMQVIFVHIKSHLKYSQKGVLQDKVKEAGFVISKTAANNIIQFNRIVDYSAKTITRKIAKDSGYYNPDGFIRLVEKGD